MGGWWWWVVVGGGVLLPHFKMKFGGLDRRDFTSRQGHLTDSKKRQMDPPDKDPRNMQPNLIV